MDLSPRPDLAQTPRTTPEQAITDPAAAQEAASVRHAAVAVDRAFGQIYGAGGAEARAAFFTAARQDGIGPASARFASEPDTFGSVVGGAAARREASLLGGALPAAAKIGALGPAGVEVFHASTTRPSGDLASARPDPARAGLERGGADLKRVLDFLYDVAESPGGSVAMAVGSFVPGLDQVLDVLDVGLNLHRVSQPEHRNDTGAWTNLGVTAVGAALPFAGDAVEAALKAVLGPGGRRAAASAMETLAPILRRAGVNPADFLDGLARRLPQLLDRGLDVATRRIGGALDRIAEPRVLIPNSVERAAAGAAGNLRALAMSAKEPLGRVGGEIREALTELADAARRSDPNPPRPDGPEPPRRVSPEIAARRDLAQDFYRRQGFDNDRSAGHLSGIDFSHPVEVVRIPRGTVVEQWAFPGKQGSYYVTPGTDPGTVGVSLRVQDSATGQIVPRERVQYRLTEDVEMLRSTAAPVTDTWSVRTQPVATQGGGIQLFTAARDGLRRVR